MLTVTIGTERLLFQALHWSFHWAAIAQWERTCSRETPPSSKLRVGIGSAQLRPKYWVAQALGPTLHTNMRNHHSALFCHFAFRSNDSRQSQHDFEVNISRILLIPSWSLLGRDAEIQRQSPTQKTWRYEAREETESWSALFHVTDVPVCSI